MEQIFKYAIILSITFPMFFLAIVAIFSVIVVLLETAFYDQANSS